MKTDSSRRDTAAARRGETAPAAETAASTRDQSRLRATLGRFTTGVAIVTALTDDQLPVGMTINSFASVSLSPPLVSWCIDQGASSHAAFARARQFAVSVLSAEQSALAMRFATRGADKFRDILVRRDRPPVIAGGCAWFVCDTYCSLVLGDHRMLIGRVIDHDSNPRTPLVFSNGRFRSLADEASQAAA